MEERGSPNHYISFDYLISQGLSHPGIFKPAKFYHPKFSIPKFYNHHGAYD